MKIIKVTESVFDVFYGRDGWMEHEWMRVEKRPGSAFIKLLNGQYNKFVIFKLREIL